MKMEDVKYTDVKNYLERAKDILAENTVEHDEFEGIVEDIEILMKKIKKEVYDE